MSVKKNAHLQKIGHTHRYHIQVRVLLRVDIIAIGTRDCYEYISPMLPTEYL